MVLLVLYVLLALGVSFLCSILEAVLLSVTPSFVAAKQAEGAKGADDLAKLKGDIDRPLAAILSLNTIAHTIGAAGAGAQALEVFGSASVAITSAILTVLILVFSEIIPKTIGARYWKRLTVFVARLMPVLIVIMYPLVRMAEWLGKLLARGDAGPKVSRSEIAALADLAVAEGVFSGSESHVLENLLRFRSITAKDVMTPRTVVIGIERGTTVAEVLRTYETIPFSRMPVFQGDMDEVTGYVLKVDIYERMARGKGDTPVDQLTRELLALPATAPLTEILEGLLAKKEHIALLVGEYGGTEGIVSLEDVVETLLGLEIVDETDEVEDMQELARAKWKTRAARYGLVSEEPDAGPKTHRNN